MAKVLMIIGPERFQEIEYNNPKKVLEKNGHTVITCSTQKMCMGHMGNTVTADVLIKEVNTDDYAAIIFVGGPGCHAYFEDKTAHRIANEFFKKGKLTCAICSAPAILANAGILKGKKTTCFPAEIEILKDKEAISTGAPVEKDGNIITASGAPAATAFGETISTTLNNPHQ
ncbi:MAG: DJ-1/PfpI family protein [Candidatus Gracilibacteria bacterium]|jgi:protease I